MQQFKLQLWLLPNPTGAWSFGPDVNSSFLESTGPFEGWPLASFFTPSVSPPSAASGVIPELIILRSWVCGGIACTGTPCGCIKRPLAAAFFLTSAATQATLSSTPLPWGGLSPIIATLRDLLTEVPELPEPPAVAIAWNAYIKSGWACRATLNIKWEIPSTHQKRNNISFREVRTAPSKKQSSDWYPRRVLQFSIFLLW